MKKLVALKESLSQKDLFLINNEVNANTICLKSTSKISVTQLVNRMGFGL